MPRHAKYFRYFLMAILIAVAGCAEKGVAIQVEVNGGTTTCNFHWLVTFILVLIGLGLLGIAALLFKKRMWHGVMPALMGLLALVLAPAMMNERVVVDDDHFECTSGWNSTDTKSVRFSDLNDITIRSRMTMTRFGPKEVHFFACHKKSGGYEEFAATGMMLKATPQIVTNAQNKGVKLIGFEKLEY